MDSSWLGVAAPVVVLGGLGIHVSRRARHPSASRRTRTWPHTTGTVLSTSIQVRRVGTQRTETPMVVYAYQVEGRSYRCVRVRAGDVGPVSGNGDATRTIARYPVGSRVVVFYDPADPSNAALER